MLSLLSTSPQHLANKNLVFVLRRLFLSYPPRISLKDTKFMDAPRRRDDGRTSEISVSRVDVRTYGPPPLMPIFFHFLRQPPCCCSLLH